MLARNCAVISGIMILYMLYAPFQVKNGLSCCSLMMAELLMMVITSSALHSSDFFQVSLIHQALPVSDCLQIVILCVPQLAISLQEHKARILGQLLTRSGTSLLAKPEQKQSGSPEALRFVSFDLHVQPVVCLLMKFD